MTNLNIKLEGRKLILKFEAMAFFRREILRQANFRSQAKTFLGANFEVKIEARPTFRPGPVNGARPGFIVWRD